ncbi:related to D-lactate dehydrogenase (cytochrome) [Melanopsichium pennsylvanicum]|uniref:D-lactate dehydrogenase (cytochrome) n=2 Tax=Melanopsichium pennsylvanicum TaxID=63383 RepID=A0AAJ4XIQ3_9BASI|nr:related to D-lactate dehydrogenase (cytochrome) [Melanopsichium pennsylvanicum 4]SNX82406.1 related to D-lactate dehydrogenase (cytochrome) [Melanopsichium pennsylvanicum]
MTSTHRITSRALTVARSHFNTTTPLRQILYSSARRQNSSTSAGVTAPKASSSPNLALALLAIGLGANAYYLSRQSSNSSTKLNLDSVPSTTTSACYTYTDPQLPFSYGTKADFEAAIFELRSYFTSQGEEWADWVTTDEDELERRGLDENGRRSSSEGTKPSVVVYVRDTLDVQAVVRIANKYRMPIIPFSGGTSLEGHYIAPFAGISIDLSRMDKVLAYHPEDGDMVVQAGIGWETINRYCDTHGDQLFFPLDPGPGATIGGMIGTGCSGTNAVRYGTARGEHFLDMQIVLANGEVISTRGGGRARKSSAGFDIGKIIVGAEGTLGIVTEATVRLAPKMPADAVAVASFPNVEAASQTVNEILLSGIPVQCIELLDYKMIQSINQSNLCGRTYHEMDSLFFKLSGGEAAVAEAKEAITRASVKYGAKKESVEFETDKVKAAKIWEGRKAALWAVASCNEAPGVKIWTTDVCVPISALPRLVRESQEDFQKSGLTGTAIVGHAGDGNFHALIPFKADDPEQARITTEVVGRLCERAQKLQGTCTGEHGVGMGKIDYLEKELPGGTIRVMKAIKLALDPKNLLNPGKLYPTPEFTPSR